MVFEQKGVFDLDPFDFGHLTKRARGQNRHCRQRGVDRFDPDWSEGYSWSLASMV
jgi:hypothetical protein